MRLTMPSTTVEWRVARRRLVEKYSLREMLKGA
jgi:hypothetical protein